MNVIIWIIGCLIIFYCGVRVGFQIHADMVDRILQEEINKFKKESERYNNDKNISNSKRID